jgi:hypothetical protein
MLLGADPRSKVSINAIMTDAIAIVDLVLLNLSQM